MFENLVESGSHMDDFQRKGSFILGTTAIYAVLLLGAFVGGIYMYDAQVENQNLELLALVAPVTVDEPKPEQKEEKPAKATEEREVATVREITSDRPELVTQGIKTETKQSPPIKGAVIGDKDYIPPGGGDPFAGAGTGTAVAPTPAPVDADEPPPVATPTPAPKPKPIVSGGVLNGKATSLPKPAYPPIAKAARASGQVTVQVTIDEAGNVISAHAISGHPLLQAAAVQAARQARFSPTLLSGQPVKVTGVITYNFIAQ